MDGNLTASQNSGLSFDASLFFVLVISLSLSLSLSLSAGLLFLFSSRPQVEVAERLSRGKGVEPVETILQIPFASIANKGCLGFRTSLSRRLSGVRFVLDGWSGALPDENLPPEHRQVGPDLSGHPQGQVVPRAADQDRATQHSGEC